MKKELRNEAHSIASELRKWKESGLGRIGKGVKCNVSGCTQEAVRSLSAEKVRHAGLRVMDERHAYLCKEHYKEYKKRTKKDKQIEKWRYGP